MTPPEWHRISADRHELRASTAVLATVTREATGWFASDGVRAVRRDGRDEAMLAGETLGMREERR